MSSAPPALLDLDDMQLGSDPDLLRLELLHVIRQSIVDHPRSHQVMIGPSELGGPCLRRIGLRLAQVPAVQHVPSWRPTVGTAVHSWLEGAFTTDWEHVAGGGSDYRWATETRVMVGHVGGQEVWGTCDLYDRCTATVVDWKIVGPTTLRATASGGPVSGYRSQVQLYGKGFRNAGLPVERVAIMLLPAAGDLNDHVWHSEPYSESIATEALARADGIASALTLAGPDIVIPALPTASHFCGSCPWFSYSAENGSATACPGHSPRASRPNRLDQGRLDL
jgi:hypothetical protein